MSHLALSLMDNKSGRKIKARALPPHSTITSEDIAKAVAEYPFDDASIPDIICGLLTGVSPEHSLLKFVTDLYRDYYRDYVLFWILDYEKNKDSNSGRKWKCYLVLHGGFVVNIAVHSISFSINYGTFANKYICKILNGGLSDDDKKMLAKSYVRCINYVSFRGVTRSQLSRVIRDMYAFWTMQLFAILISTVIAANFNCKNVVCKYIDGDSER